MNFRLKLSRSHISLILNSRNLFLREFMGFWQSILLKLGFYKQKLSILCVGLDNSGKSTIINNLNSEFVLYNLITNRLMQKLSQQ